MIDHHTALIYVMVLISASDGDMTDDELAAIGENVRYLPVFHDFDPERLPDVASECTAILSDVDGLEKALGLIRRALPPVLCETAYAVGCDIVAADTSASEEELRLLEMLRERLSIDRLTAVALERGARARHMRL